jgi:superfamily II DNA or RNA helicase
VTQWSGVDEEELGRSFGSATLSRGRCYAEEGRVSQLQVSGEGHGVTLVSADVLGSAGRRYRTHLTVVEGTGDLYLDSRCSCPVARMCKHGVAVALAARPAGSSEGRGWERRLGGLLEELEDAAKPNESRRGLALQVELPATRSRWAEHHTRGGLRLRPLVRSARGSWVKSGAGWDDLPRLVRTRQVDVDQGAALHEVLLGYRAASATYYYGGEPHLPLERCGGSVWRSLESALSAGVELVPAGALQAVTVATDPVRVLAEATRDVSGARVRLGVRHQGEWYDGDRVELLGEPGHGVALWIPGPTGWEVQLVPLLTRVGPRTRRLLAGDALRVPPDEADDLVTEVLPRLARHVPVASPDESVRLPEQVEPRLALQVDWRAADEVRVTWQWRYRLGPGADDRVYELDEERGLRGLRRPDRERELLAVLALDADQAHLLGRGRSDPAPVARQTFSGVRAVAFHDDALVPLERSGQVEIHETGTRPDYRETTATPVIRFAGRPVGGSAGGQAVDEVAPDGPALVGRTDWLDLEVIITVEGRSVGLATLLEAMTAGAERIVLRDGTHLRIDIPEFAQLFDLVRDARELQEQPDGGVRVGRHDLGLWDELAEIGLVDEQAARWVAAAQALRSPPVLPDVEPVGIRAELRSYQREGFRWLAFLWQLGLGGILADDMGLGKTLQTLALIAHARARDADPFLVVAPTSVVATWAQQAATFAPGLTVRTVTSSRARRGEPLAELHHDADVVVTSYTLYRLEVDDYVALDWGGLVLDEAQIVKNHQGKTHQGVRRLDVPFRLALTGTPLENRLLELWSLLSIVAPGLYPSPRRFVETVADPVEKEGDAQALARFRRRVRPFLLRRTKDLVAADLPPKQEQVVEVPLGTRHRRIYQTRLQRERQHVLGLLGDFDRQRVAIFRSLTRLRQLALDPALVDAEHEHVGSAKLEVLLDHLHELSEEGHRALVFSQFTSYLRRVRERLDREGIETVYLDGRSRDRGALIEEFRSGTAPVFLISLKAGGVGLTLTEADYVFVLDPWWNPAVEAQAVDRAHRIGQTRPVIVYRLVAAETIEEKVMELKARKAALFGQVMDGAGGVIDGIDADDVRAILED